MARAFYKQNVDGYFADEIKHSGYIFPTINLPMVRWSLIEWLNANPSVHSAIVWRKEGSMIYQEGVVKRDGKKFTWTSTHNPHEIDRTLTKYGELRGIRKKTVPAPFGL